MANFTMTLQLADTELTERMAWGIDTAGSMDLRFSQNNHALTLWTRVEDISTILNQTIAAIAAQANKDVEF